MSDASACPPRLESSRFFQCFASALFPRARGWGVGLLASLVLGLGLNACSPAKDARTGAGSEPESLSSARESGGGRSTESHGESGHESGEDEQVELAVLMARLQYHSTKLGYAIDAENDRLARFYLQELGEVTNEVLHIEVDSGVAVGALARNFLLPNLGGLRRALDTGDREAIPPAYKALIQSCNTCHVASQHEFLVIEVPKGPPAFNQDFAPR